MIFAFVTLLIWVNAPWINYLIPSRKCSIEAPAINEESLFAIKEVTDWVLDAIFPMISVSNYLKQKVQKYY